MDHRITFKESLFLLPVLILLGIFSVYTICQTAIYSFFDYQLSDPVKTGCTSAASSMPASLRKI